jgi:hypothetical protein
VTGSGVDVGGTGVGVGGTGVGLAGTGVGVGDTTIGPAGATHDTVNQTLATSTAKHLALFIITPQEACERAEP